VEGPRSDNRGARDDNAVPDATGIPEDGPPVEVSGRLIVDRPSEVSEEPWILVTNDDGVDSPGIQRLASRLAAENRVVVVAPSVDRSGAGTGIGHFDPAVGVDLHEVGDREVPTYSMDGPPGLAVMAAALGAFGRSPRMVVSGINAGINTGQSVIHSGTVGAALTARTFGSHGLAVSVSRSDPWQWDAAAEIAAGVAGWMLGQSGTPLVINLNVPARPLEEVEGLRWAELDSFGHFQVAVRSPGKLGFEVSAPSEGRIAGSDTALLEAGYATLTILASVEGLAAPDGDGPRWRFPASAEV
jgi:5'-nucleotidase